MDTIFNDRLKEYCGIVEAKLEEFVNTHFYDELAMTLNKAMRYSLSAGGKRIRPVLVFEFCRICGGDIENAISAACAIEMIHTFSLIHDDLPAMDDDDMRRGKPSCHKAFGEAQAILAGDALATLPYQIIACDDKLSPECIAKLINVLSVETNAMIAGQVIDIENENRDIDLELLDKLYLGKTCALLRASCKMGAICAGAADKKVNLAQAFAEKLGLAFQIIDDILDVVGDEENLGKPIGSDAQQNKKTYVTLIGLEESKNTASELSEQALIILDDFDDNEFLKQLTIYLLERNS